jgi:hypothetical protein
VAHRHQVHAGMPNPVSYPWHGEGSTLDWEDVFVLHAAAERGDVERLRALLQDRSVTSSIDEQEPQRGWTPLQYALSSAQEAAAGLLLESGATAHSIEMARGEPPCPPLLLALHSGSWRLCQMLIVHLKGVGLLKEAATTLFQRHAGAASLPAPSSPPRVAATPAVPLAHKTRSGPQPTRVADASREQGRRASRALIVGPGYVIVGEVSQAALLSETLFECHGREGVCIVNTLWAKQPASVIKARLVEGTQELLVAPNLGGQSELSEALSFEVLAQCCAGTISLSKTEREIRYNELSGQRTDYVINLASAKLAVSVTRAYEQLTHQKRPFGLADADKLLRKKLKAVNVTNEHNLEGWRGQLLHSGPRATASQHSSALPTRSCRLRCAGRRSFS